MEWLKNRYLSIGRFLRRDAWSLLWFCTGVFVVTGIFCYWILRGREQELMQMLENLVEMFQQKGIQDSQDITPWLLIGNNLKATGLIVVLGVVPFLFLPLVALGENAAILSVAAAGYRMLGIPLSTFWAGLLPHGILELPAIVLSAVLGCYLCREVVKIVIRSPKRKTLNAILEKSLTCYFLVVVPMILAAGFLEAYVTPMILNGFLS
mgnify:CR=1 FL=1